MLTGYGCNGGCGLLVPLYSVIYAALEIIKMGQAILIYILPIE